MITSKRIFDLTFAGLLFFILSPVLVSIAITIKLNDKGNVFFKQKRIGFKGKPFLMYKFRTMVKNAEKIGGSLTIGKDPRITKIGFWLRKFKLDEIPQLINVINNEMSIVGPRPEVQKYVELYNNEQKEVLNLMPGITDPASIKYSNESAILKKFSDPEDAYIKIIMPEKIQINLNYASSATIWTDFYVILQTLKIFDIR
ncbi:MAG: sugar transferase [Desulfobacterales bacterium]|nr:sugar transferase [Desulfobacterales bacterium]